MKITQSGIDEFLGLLDDTPRRVTGAVAGFTNADLQTRPGGKGWSVNEILAHLRACVDMWAGSIESMLAEDEPALEDINPRVWVKSTDYPAREFSASFEQFCLQRKKLLQILRKLPFDSWARSAMIGDRRHTVFSQVRRMARHESEHCTQIEELLKK